MKQSLRDQCQELAEYITEITGTTCVMMDLAERKFEGEPFRDSCNAEQCDALNTHLYGAYQAERWDDKYIYYCPRGLAFLATPVRQANGVARYCLLTGPIILDNFPEDKMYGGISDIEGLEHVPSMTTKQTNAWCEVIRSAIDGIAGRVDEPLADPAGHKEMLQMMYDLSREMEDVPQTRYPIDSERELQQMIRHRDKEGVQRLLNELMGYVYFASGANFAIIKARATELLVVMSRAAIEGGGDINEIFGMNDTYTKEIEQMRDMESLNIWLNMVAHKFISCMFDFSEVKHRDIMFKITEYVKQNLAEKLTIEDAAAHVYVSKSHLSRILRQEMGCTFTEYVNRQRVERSKLRLISGRASLADIAVSVGFEDQSYFTRVFKKITGVTPGKYREQRL